MRLCLIIFFIYSSNTYAINSCSAERTFSYKKIDCCLSDKLSKKVCKNKIDSLQPKFLQQIGEVRSEIELKLRQELHIPNCFWLSLAFFDSHLLSSPQYINEGSFLTHLQSHYLKTDLAKIKLHDLIHYKGQQEFFHDYIESESSLIVDQPFHSAIYIGDGIVLQKENSSDAIFSVVLLEDSYAGYTKAYKKSYDGVLSLEVYSAVALIGND